MEATLQTIFLLGFAAYAARHALPAYIHKAAWCIMNCRTAVLGGHVEVCPEGHFERNHYNSCRHRICPQCAFLQVQKWLVRQQARLLACDHYHVVFTIAHELNCLWPFNDKLMTDTLFNSARATILELLADPKYLGAKPGIIASLHTWSKTLILHTHIHCLVTGGGLKDGRWLNLRYDYLFPFAVARVLFRAKVLEAITQALDKEKLHLPDHLTDPEVRKIIKKAWRKKWNVHIREKYSHGEGVLSYVARYLRGGPIATSRIAKIEDNKVTFHVGRNKKQLMTLTIEEFLRRYLQHIPKPGSRVIRSYGLYAAASKKQLRHCHKLFGKTLSEATPPIHWQDLLESAFSQATKPHDTPWLCPICGKRLITGRRIPPRRRNRPNAAPPPMWEGQSCPVT